MTPISVLPSFEPAVDAFSVPRLNKILTPGFWTAFPASARRLDGVVVRETTFWGMDDMPDDPIIPVVLDASDKVVVCSSAW
jgi:hypothetical protein